MSWVGLDSGRDHLDAAEHDASLLADLLGCADEVCTHTIPGPAPHYAASLRIPAGRWTPQGPEALRGMADGALAYEEGDWAIEVGSRPGRAGARTAIAAHAAGTGGRALRFRGQHDLRGALTIDAILEASAIQEVEVLGAASTGRAVVDTRDFVRPHYRNGRLTLVVTPLDENRLQPFELEHAHQCCDGH